MPISESHHRSTTADAAIVTWCLNDGRPGHRRQVEGLVRQLSERRPLEVHWIEVCHISQRDLVKDLFRREFSSGARMPDPVLIVGAGHATHLPALAARRARGGKAVVLMKPTLPSRLFDLCLVPEHDKFSAFGRLTTLAAETTRGVLNPFAPATKADPMRALILLGGPSRHHKWCDDSIRQQIHEIRRFSPVNVQWTLTTSRRTPTSTIQAVLDEVRSNIHSASIKIVPYDQTGPGWLSEQFSQCRTVFVSEDSVSMIYESLTVGADVGVLKVPRRGRSRNARCIDRLLQDKLIVSFDDWRADRFEHRRQVPFNEASRCAEIICQRLLDAA